MNQEFQLWLAEKKKENVHNEVIQMEEIIAFLDNMKCLLFPGYADAVSDLSAYLEEAVLRIRTNLQGLLASVEGIENGFLDKERLIEDFFKEIPIIDFLLKTDIEALYEGDPAASSKTEIILCYPGLTAIFIYRIAHGLYKLGIPILPRALSEYAHGKTGIDIHPGAKIDAYFFIDHGTGIVIGQTCVIGKNVKIYQGVTLGALSLKAGQRLKGQKRHPTLEDNVTVYSGASIFGGDTVIGKNTTIGSNAFITSSVEEDMTVTIQGQKKKHK